MQLRLIFLLVVGLVYFGYGKDSPISEIPPAYDEEAASDIPPDYDEEAASDKPPHYDDQTASDEPPPIIMNPNYANEIQKQELSAFMKRCKADCKVIQDKQKAADEKLRTGIPCLRPKHQITYDYQSSSKSGIENLANHPDWGQQSAVIPDTNFVEEEHPESRLVEEKINIHCYQKLAFEERILRDALVRMYQVQNLDDVKSEGLKGLEDALNEAEAAIFYYTRDFNNRFLVRSVKWKGLYIKDLTWIRFEAFIKPILKYYNRIRLVNLELDSGKWEDEDQKGQTQTHIRHMQMRIVHIARIMNHNLPLIAFFNRELSFDATNFWRCAKGQTAWNVHDGRFVLTVYMTEETKVWYFFLAVGITFSVFPLVVAIPALVLAAATHISLLIIHGLRMLASDNDIYVNPNSRYTALIKKLQIVDNYRLSKTLTDVAKRPLTLFHH